MKHWSALTGIVLLIGGCLVWSEKRKAEAPVSPKAILYLVADTQRELTRLPVAFTHLSDEEEISIGDELARRYETEAQASSGKRPASEAAIEGYIRNVGERVAVHAHRKLPYRFHYLDQPALVNAFALPGGHVFVGNGLLALMDTEDELAAVLGHEIEHIDHYHCAERAQLEAALRRIPLGGLVGIPIEVFEAGYSKDEEMEADREGTKLAVATGYSPLGALRLYQTFDRLNREYVTKAESPEEELGQVTIQTLEGYFRSHPLPSERIEEVRRMIRTENWEKLTTERPLAVEYLFWTQRAQGSQAEHQYGQAAKLAARSLELHPDQPGALDVLAWAQFMQAQFAESAATIRKLLDRQPEDVALARRYSSALGATGDSQRAAWEFQSWMDSVKYSDPAVVTQMKVDEAGLWLLAGNDKPAAAMAQQLRKRTDAEWAPECMGRLGWWYYGAGEYDAAASLLSDAVELWPGSLTSQLQLGWTYVAQQKYESALQRFGQAQSSGETAPVAAMGLAVANWRARRGDEAVAYCSFSIEKEPAWRNERWITALYGSSVAASIAEIQAERERRLKAERKGQTRPST